jgi:hypothetical protein
VTDRSNECLVIKVGSPFDGESMDSGPADSDAILLLLWRSRGLSAATGDVCPDRRTGRGHLTPRATVRQECDEHINDRSSIRARPWLGRQFRGRRAAAPALWSPRGPTRMLDHFAAIDSSPMPRCISVFATTVRRANRPLPTATARKRSMMIRPRIRVRARSSGLGRGRALLSARPGPHFATMKSILIDRHGREYGTLGPSL